MLQSGHDLSKLRGPDPFDFFPKHLTHGAREKEASFLFAFSNNSFESIHPMDREPPGRNSEAGWCHALTGKSRSDKQAGQHFCPSSSNGSEPADWVDLSREASSYQGSYGTLGPHLVDIYMQWF